MYGTQGAVGLDWVLRIDRAWREARHTVKASQCALMADHVAGTASAVTWSKRAMFCLDRDYPDGLPLKVREWAEANLYWMPGRWAEAG